ncbi:MAG: DUF6492 family protein [Rickettsiales bacterium]|nr:DUF6492 family protein [Rickettsiales bacterium]
MDLEKIPTIDVVIPAHEKDVETLKYCIRGVKKNVVGARRIIVISKEKYTDEAQWFDEALFPFSFQEIAGLVKGAVGWHFQQLLKLYSPLIIPEISPDVLIVDADTVFLRRVKFFSDDNLPLYNLSKDTDLENSPFHQITYKHITKILPEIDANLPQNFKNVSGICHHMLLQKHIIEDLFFRVEKQAGGAEPFYKVFLKNSEAMYGVAEYNLYFYFLVSLHPQEYKIRFLRYKNTADFSLWKYRFRRKYHYCSFHSYMRKPKESLITTAKNFFLKKLIRIFYFDHWDIGVIKFPIEQIIKRQPEIFWIKNHDKLNFLADPFGIEIAGQKYLLFEDYSQIKKYGRIGLALLNNDLTLSQKKIILDDKKHLSYPFIIKHEDKIYLVCESYKANKLSLYELDCQELKLKKIRDIFTDKKIVDPTIFYHQNKFWMFYTIADSSDFKLNIAFANSLFDEFIEHPNNPVKIDKSSSRSAGTPFLVDNKIYRPTQNCSQSYGSAVIINQIVELNEKVFREEFVKEIKPEEGSIYKGFHTLSAFGNLTLIDGKRRVFLWYKPLISVFRNLVRIFK